MEREREANNGSMAGAQQGVMSKPSVTVVFEVESSEIQIKATIRNITTLLGSVRSAAFRAEKREK